MHEGKLLCVRHKGYENSISAGSWCLPGGGLDPSEALVPAVEREMIEETGVKPQVGNLLYIQQFAANDKEFLEFFFHVTNAQDYLNIDLSSTSHGGTEIDEISFIEPGTSEVLPKFLSTEPLEEVIVAAGPPKIFSQGLKG